MNRIKISPLAYSDSSESPSGSQLSTAIKHDFDNTTQHQEQATSVFVPMHYEKNYRYPLVVWLHSDAEDRQGADSETVPPATACGSSSEIHKLMPLVSMRNYVAIAPNVQLPSDSSNDRKLAWPQTSQSIDLTHTAVIKSIETAMTRFNINSDRIFLGGCGSGGTMAFRIAMERPELFAGAMSVNGPMPELLSPLANWEACRNLPVFWTQGRGSTGFDSATLCRQLKLLHVAGFALTLRQYPSNSSLFEKLLQDMNRWIMEVVTSPQACQRRAK